MRKWQLVVVVMGLTLILLALYQGAWHYPFQFDSVLVVLKNPKICHFSWPGIYEMFFSPVEEWPGRRHLFHWSLILNYKTGGYNPVGYRILSLSLHLANAWLSFCLVYLTIMGQTKAGEDKSKQTKAFWAAFFIALAFAVHPVQTESVTYVNGRPELLAGFFFLAGLLCYRQSQLSRPPLCFYFWAGLCSCYVLGLISKEHSVTLPLAVFLYDYSFLCGADWRTLWRKWTKRGLLAGAVLIATAWYSLTLVFRTDRAIGFGVNLTYVTPYNYLLTQFRVICHYARLLFFPWEQNLDYDFPVSTSFFEPATFFAFVALAGVLVAAVALRKTHPCFFFNSSLFFLVLMPTSSFIPIENTAAEHRLYLPSIAFFAILGLCSRAIYLRCRKPARVLAVAMLVAYICFLGAKTHWRNLVWQDEITLWQDTIRKSPGKARGHIFLGGALLGRGRLSEAVEQFEKAVSLDPQNAKAHLALGTVCARRKDYARAIAMYEMAFALDPKPEIEKAVCDLCREYTAALVAAGKVEEAIAISERLVSFEPDDPVSHYNLGILYDTSNQLEKAIASFHRAIALNFAFAESHKRLGHIWLARGRTGDAIQSWRTAVAIDPKDAETWTNIAGIYLECGKPDEARDPLYQALRIAPRDGKVHFNFGVYYYQTGRLDLARQFFERYLALAPDAPDADRVKEWIGVLQQATNK